MTRRANRRKFLKASAAVGFGVWSSRTPAYSASPNEKLNIGMIGVGGKGESNILGVMRENIIAMCDVDQARAAKGYRMASKSNKYSDFRKMLDKEKTLDAVVVSTPDHTHAIASLTAMRQGKHVYCEKPLAHSVYESRLMQKVAKEQKVATQMGNQGHSGPILREAVQKIQAGELGQVREFHAWTNRPSWEQGIVSRPSPTDVPSTLDWDLWLGPAPERPYNPAYCPFKWRGWWDFGTGALGDMACHIADLGFWGLKLEYPTSVEARTDGVNPETAPKWSVIKYEFPERGGLAPVTFTWYDGGKKPDPALVYLNELPGNGSILVGDKAIMYVPDEYGRVYQILPKELKGSRPPLPAPASQMSIISVAAKHYLEWTGACKGGPAAQSNFDYAALLTEVVLLGNIATRLGRKIAWDGPGMKVPGAPEADVLVSPPPRKGWEFT